MDLDLKSSSTSGDLLQSEAKQRLMRSVINFNANLRELHEQPKRSVAGRAVQERESHGSLAGLDELRHRFEHLDQPAVVAIVRCRQHPWFASVACLPAGPPNRPNSMTPKRKSEGAGTRMSLTSFDAAECSSVREVDRSSSVPTGPRRVRERLVAGIVESAHRRTHRQENIR